MEAPGQDATVSPPRRQWPAKGWARVPAASAATGAPVTGVGSGRCLDIAGASRATGTPAIIWDCHGDANQRWTLTAAGELLDGEGGYTVWGKLVSAATSVRERLLPVALAHHVPLKNDVSEGRSVSWDDVVIDESLNTALELRRETEALVHP